MVEAKFLTAIDASQLMWYTKLVVNDGNLDRSQSTANFGTLPLDF